MNPVILTLIIIIIILVIAYLIYYFAYSGEGSQSIIKDITPLSNKKDVLISDKTKELILGSSGTTVSAFFKLNGGDRTIKYNDTYTPILQVDNNWYLEISPAPNNSKETAARLRVMTQDTSINNDNIIELPTIPQQKWVFIAILRDGRRFDVIYDNQIVASKRLQNYPVVINSPLSIGSAGIDGSIVNLTVTGTRLSPIDVERLRSSMVNTNGVVIQDNIFSKALSIPLLSLNMSAKCPPGLPCDSITRAPNHLTEWKTPYA